MNDSDQVQFFGYLKAANSLQAGLAADLLGQHHELANAVFSGQHALHTAIKYQSGTRLPLIMIGYGADVNTKDSGGRTALHLAVLSDYLPLVVDVMEADAILDAQDINGHTAIHLAVYQEKIGMVRVLIEKGADLNIEDLADQSPLRMARIKCNPNIAMLLQKHGATI